MNEKYFPTKFDSAVDEALYILALEGWSGEESGNSEAPTGWFCTLSISDDDLAELPENVRELLATYGIRESALIGHYLISTDSSGFVYVAVYADTKTRDEDYAKACESFWAWEDFEEE